MPRRCPASSWSTPTCPGSMTTTRRSTQSSPSTRTRARRSAGGGGRGPVAGDALGPLHGLPITLKDSYETARHAHWSGGRPDLADYVPTQDAEAVARLRRAGAIILGKTNMPTRQCRRASQQSRVRPDKQSVGSVAHLRRIGRRRRRRYGGRSDELRLRLRNRWLHPAFRRTSVASTATSRRGSRFHSPATSRAGQAILAGGLNPTWPAPECRPVAPATSSPRWKPPSAR